MNAPQPANTAVPQPVVVPTRRGGRTRVIVALCAIGAALGFIVVRGLGEATQFFRPADQAVAQRTKLGTHRFSLIGVVVDGSVVSQPATNGSPETVAFRIEQNGTQIDVVHTGVPPELFKPGMPVLLDGHFQSATGKPVFLSDRMAIKHSADYKSENPDRVAVDAP